MSEPIYERYKDALKRGHVATARGRLDAALAAYVEAAEIAPERALPHTSIGHVYARLGRLPEALAAYDLALDRAPDDEAALEGRAGSLAALGRPVDAARTLDRLAALQEAGGRSAEAVDTARRALELAEARVRRRRVETLVARLREQPADASAADALARAVQLLERGVGEEPGAAPAGGSGSGGRHPDEPAGSTGPEAPGEAAAELAGPPEPPPDPLELIAAAGHAIEAGDAAEARARLLEAADGLERGGRPDAALDACYEALAFAPADPDLHLLLARLYLDRGWRSLAAEKLVRLHRLAELDADEGTVDRVRALAVERLADEPAAAGLIEDRPAG